MKRALVSFTAVALCGLIGAGFLNSLSSGTASAQKGERPAAETKADVAMAEQIARVTNRSSEGLESEAGPFGIEMDLQGRFQNVMLARVEEDGTPAAACVTSLGEANSFFGRNLETGARVPKTDIEKPLASAAADHGMSETEYKFYQRLIEEAKAKMALRPDAATINIANLDGSNEGFNDPAAPFVANEGGNSGATRGAQRLNVFTSAAAIWGSFLDSGVTTTVNAQFDALACSSGSAVLGSAGATTASRDFTNAPFSGTWFHGALANKIRGVDPAPGAEISAQFNSNLDNGCFSGSSRFYYGLDGNNPAGTTNLLVVVLHEIGHGLGFSSFVNGSTGALNGGFPDIYTRFMFDRTVGLYWYQMTDLQRAASALNNGNVFWDGPNVKIASGYLTGGRESATGRVALHTPASFSPGSSISHFSTAAAPNLLMEPNINAGLAITGDLARQQMRDIGWFRDTAADASADTITGVAPNSGNTVVIGTQQTISWTNSGGFNRDVTIELSTDGGVTYTAAVATNIANTGSYSWTVPNSPTTAARIRVREADFAAPSGMSSTDFTISAASTAAGVTVSGRVSDQNGFAVGRATVTLTDAQGSTRIATTNPFGYFVFEEVPVGESYIAGVRHKRLRFGTQLLNLTDSFTGLDFVAEN